MAKLRVDGRQYVIPDEMVEELKLRLARLQLGGYEAFELSDEDGDLTWVRIPQAAPVAIYGLPKAPPGTAAAE